MINTRNEMLGGLMIFLPADEWCQYHSTDFFFRTECGFFCVSKMRRFFSVGFFLSILQNLKIYS